MNHDQHPAAYRDQVGRLGDTIVSLLQDHERRVHHGERCPEEAVNMLAYLAHRVGLQPDPAALTYLEKRLRDYNASHAEHHVYGGPT